MSTDYEDWADWAGDHPEQAEEDLRKERERAEASCARVIRAGLLQPAAVAVDEECAHDNPDNDYECLDCGSRIEGWEPTDAQIFAHYGQTKETAA